MIYLDTGCLVKLYYPEPDSAAVAAKVAGQPIAFTQLHELELTNALQQKRFHQSASILQVTSALALVTEDLGSGVLTTAYLDWAEVMRLAASFADQFTNSIGCRSLDILHCAAASKAGITNFLSTDNRQRKLAAAIGLNVLNL